MKIRLAGMNFFFDASLVKQYRCAHYVPPARYRRPKEEEAPHQDIYLNQDLWERDYPFAWS